MSNLKPASRDDVLFAVRMAIILDHSGKAKKPRQPMTDTDVQIMAEKITDDLRAGNLWPHRGPGAKIHSSSDFDGSRQNLRDAKA